ncbi:MAG: leucine-rich repeat protein, partial [Clostridia bacterium]|nr:leucine-rich repeat protein [Clostridia bacterium]
YWGELLLSDPLWLIKADETSNTDYEIFGNNTTIIAGGAFDGFNNLSSVKIPESVKSICKNAFEKCINLNTVNYYGTNTDWNNIVIEEGNDPLLNAQRVRPPFTVPVYINGVDDGTATGFCEWNEDDTITLTISAEEQDSYRMTITSVGFDSAGVDGEAVRSLVINAPVEGIDTNAFRNLTNLESITLPESLRSINADAFDGTAYYNNKENWENGVLYIGDCLIKADRGIEGSYTAKEGSRLITDGAFYGCTKLTGVTVPGSVEIIGKDAFNNCVKLADITLPGSLKNIGADAFTNTAYYNDYANWTVTNILYRELYIGGCLIDVERYQSNRDYYPVRIDAACVADCAFAKIVDNNGKCDIYVLNENTVFSDNAFSGLSFTNNSASKVYYYGTRDDWNNSNSRLGYDSSLQCIYEGGYFTTSSIGNIFNPSDNLKITGLNQTLRVLKIPGEINGKTVTEIASSAFEDNTGIDSLYIPETIAKINTSAFSGCRNLSYIYCDAECSLGGTFFTLYPFYNVGSDTDGVILEFGENVTTVKSWAFNPIFLSAFKIKKLIIPANVTTIEANAFRFVGATAGPIGGGYDYEFGWDETIPPNAFSNMSSLQNITLPEGIISIGDSAFYGCKMLESINIPGCLTSIGTNAFGGGGVFGLSGLSNLKTVNYYGTIKDWCNISFANRTANPINSSKKLLINGVEITEIKKADINGVTEIKPFAFCGMTGLTNVTLPETVTIIGASAFYGCTKLESINIPEGITSISSSTFSGCAALTNIEMPESVTSIGSSAFSGCWNLPDDFTVPAGVTSIGANAFYDVFNVKYEGSAQGAPWGAKSVNGVVKTYEGTDGNKYKLVFAPTTEKASSKSVLLGCSADAAGTVTVPRSVSYVGDRAFANCSGIETIIFNAAEPGYGKDPFVGCPAEKIYTVTEVYARDVIYGDEGTRLISCNKNRKDNYTVPEGVRIIEENAFYNCDKLGSITLPGSVVSVGAHAFEGTSTYTAAKASPVTVEDKDGNGTFTLVYIGGCLVEATWVQKETADEQEGETGEAQEEPTVICELPEKTTCIAANAFSGCPELTGVVLDKSLKGISENAFAGCSKLKTITAAEGICIEHVGENAFAGTAYYSTNSNWQNGALYIADCLVKVKPATSDGFTVAEGTTCIADRAFDSCKSLTSVTVPEGVVTIGSNAFDGCTAITEITLGEGTESIGNEAFEYCTALTAVEIPSTVSRIGNRAFYRCDALEEITVRGNSRNLPVYYSVNGVLFRNKNTGTEEEPVFEKHLVAYPAARDAAEYEIPEGEASVFDNFAFAYCEKLEKVTFHGVSYRTVAFYECGAERISDNLREGVEVSEDGTMLMQVTAAALDEDDGFIVPDGVRTISGAAFSSVKNKLTSIDLNGAQFIVNGAFEDCTELETVTGSEDVLYVGDNAFNGCKKLEGINLSGVNTICPGAFRRCPNLNDTNVIISRKAVFAADSFDFKPDSNLKIDTYSNETVSSRPVPESGELTIDYGSNVTLDTLTEIPGEIVWLNARTGDVITGGRTATLSDVNDDVEIQAVIMEDSGILVQSAPVKIIVDNIPVEIEIPDDYNSGDNTICCD